MPAPTDIPDITGTDEEGNEVVRKSSDDEPFAALAFKIMTDPFVGKLAFFRVYSGTLNSGSYVLNATKQKKERVGRIVQMHANSRSEIDKVYSGDIAAAVGFKITTTGDTICDEQHPVILESMEFPEPVIELAMDTVQLFQKKGQQESGGAAEQRRHGLAHAVIPDGNDHQCGGRHDAQDPVEGHSVMGPQQPCNAPGQQQHGQQLQTQPAVGLCTCKTLRAVFKLEISFCFISQFL